MNDRVVGVAGAGVMGTGVAQNLAQTAHRVILLDVSDAILDRSRQEMMRSLRFRGFMDKTQAAEPAEEVVERIEFSTDYGALAEADFVIENVPEKWDVKKAVYEELDRVCPARCILASNTSAIPITRIASVTGRGPQVIGTHFMNPAPMKRVVEVIPGKDTSAETLERTKGLLAAMGKEWVVVRDSPGFVSNRVLMLTVNEAMCLVQDDVAAAEDVDRIFKECFGHKMGPLETADLIGLDTILHSLEVLEDSFSDKKYRPCALLREMVAAGQCGRKSGKGFYVYPTHSAQE